MSSQEFDPPETSQALALSPQRLEFQPALDALSLQSTLIIAYRIPRATHDVDSLIQPLRLRASRLILIFNSTVLRH